MRMIYFFWAIFWIAFSLAAQAQDTLPPWREGLWDIHHISTGRGNAAFMVFPDGTTLLLDAGEISDTHPRTRSLRNSVLRPDSTQSAAAWIVDYIRQFHPDSTATALDFAVLTHFHDDHFGEWDETRPLSRSGAFRLTGITAVGEALPIRHLIDRGWHFPIDLQGSSFRERYRNDTYHIVQTLDNYWTFVRYAQRADGLRYDTLRPGSSRQIGLQRRPESYPNFQVRNIAANGRIWTGFADEEYVPLFGPGQYPGENPLSLCLKMSYGPFDYFAGGDISGVDELGGGDWQSVEAHVAPVTGAVDVASLNHHGNRDSQSPFFVRTLRPRVWVQQCWSSDHPGEEVLRRITSAKLYPGPRALFTTDMLEANQQVIGEKIGQSYQNLHGHVVVRVGEGGRQYWVYVLNDFSKKREVLAVHGPFVAR